MRGNMILCSQALWTSYPRKAMTATPAAQDDLIDQVAGFRYLKHFGHLFASLHNCGTADDKAGNRRLFYDPYAALLLLYFFSPTLTSLRGLQRLTEAAKVQQATGCRRTSL